MPHPKDRSQVRHVSAASVDTNASAIAESTISLGLSRFPAPPSSIPTTPVRSNFNNSPSSSLRNFPQPNDAASVVLPLRKHNSEAKAEKLQLSPGDSVPSSKLERLLPSCDPPQPSSSSHIISAYDWHDGASSIAVDAAEDRLLPTSFITSLLQENQKLGNPKRSSYSSDAFSNISEMTYPPLVNRSINSNFRSPPSSFSHPVNTSQISGESGTLHSSHPSVTSMSNARAPPGTRNSVTSPTLHAGSNASQISSTLDSDTLGSVAHGYQRKLSTTFESGEENTTDYKYYSYQKPTGGHQKILLQESLQQDACSRHSVYSHRSVAPSLISRVSGLSLGRVFNWRRAKPLPPVPKIPDISLAEENAFKKEDESTPLPDLVNRAGVLRDLLDRGHHPHHSLNSYQVLPVTAELLTPTSITGPQARKTEYSGVTGTPLSPSRKKIQSASLQSNSFQSVSYSNHKRIRLWVLIIAVVLVATAIGVGVGVTVGKKKNTVESSCTGNFVGSSCNLDGSCVCTSSSGCNGLAQSIIDLLPTVNNAFDTNITTAMAYSSIWIMQGSPTTRSCKSQALLLDVGKGLDQAKYPNRTQWAQAALLWNAIQTQYMPSSQQMQTTVQGLPWSSIASADGPVEADPAFSVTSSGFIFNFASQSLSQPPASFLTLGQPSSAQIARLSPTANTTLNRMYMYASASSTQRDQALTQYWTSVLLRDMNDLATFKAAFSHSPIMLAFNASSSSIRNLYVSSPTSSFPPPLSCFPGLDDTLLQALNTVESNAFGLEIALKASQFETQCYPDRPIYGVLNVLRLRLPFPDSETGVNRQAVVLTQDASTRAVLYNGQLFSSISNISAAFPPVSSVQWNPLQYGTVNQLNHIILQYLTSIPDINTANNLIQFVLNVTNAGPIPPDATSPIFQSLSVLPSVEVALFGTVQSADLLSTVSPFTTPSNSLFFGSPDGSALRNWTINSSSGTIIWTQNSTSALVAHDSSLNTQSPISQTWQAASLGVEFNVTSITLANVTLALQRTNSLTPQ